MSMTRLLVTAGVLLTGLVVGLVSPGVGIRSVLAGHVSCGATITATTTLDGPLVDCAGDGLIIGADGITLDGGGFEISGTGSGDGIIVGPGRTGVTITKVTVSGFPKGIFLDGADGNTIATTTVTDNGVGIQLTASDSNFVQDNLLTLNAFQIFLTGDSTSNTIAQNTVTGDFGSPILGIFVESGSGNIIEDNTITDHLAVDADDATTGAGTAGTDNTWTGNACDTSSPVGLCAFAPPVDLDGDGSTSDVDCDDGDGTIFPGATEIPDDGIDQDCDGFDLTDVDGDTFFAILGGGDDGDDNNILINPLAAEIAYDGIDQDCDGFDLTDVDLDGFDSDAIGVGGDDCDDTIFLGAAEIADDGIDQDCDGFDLTARGGGEVGAVRAALVGLSDGDLSDNPNNKNKARNNRRWFENQLDSIEDNVEAGLFDAALDNANNLLRKVDGCVNQSPPAPDSNDKVRTCSGQAVIYPLIIDLIASL